MRTITYRMHPMSLVVLCVGLVWMLVTRQQPNMPIIATTNQRVPDIAAQTPNGTVVRTTQQIGHPVIYILWASWCPPCRAELPVLQALDDDLRAANIELILVNQGEDATTAAAWLRTQHITLTDWYDPASAFAVAFQTHDLPSSVFVDASGVVDLVYRGPVTHEIIDTMREAWQPQRGMP